MTRWLRTTYKDAVLQYRGGFWLVGGAVALIYVGILSRIPSSWPINLPLILPLALTVNALITTFYFVAGLVLLERSEGTLAASAVSPLRPGEYLAAKAASLTVLALAENALVLVMFYGTGFDPWLLVAGMVSLCAFYTLVGVATISRFDSINAFLIPSGVVITAFLVPPLVFHFRADASWLVWLHPLQPFLSLVRAAFLPASRLEVIYGAVAGLLWLVGAYAAARRGFARLILQ